MVLISQHFDSKGRWRDMRMPVYNHMYALHNRYERLLPSVNIRELHMGSMANNGAIYDRKRIWLHPDITDTTRRQT